MKLSSGKFKITRADDAADANVIEKDGLVIGRLQSSDIFLNHPSISRMHAGINRVGEDYFLINLSISNSLTLNGKLLSAEEADVLADGDIIQVGPFAITVSLGNGEISLFIVHHFAGNLQNTADKLPPLAHLIPQKADKETSDVLKVFWEKRTRDKDERGVSLRPKGKPEPGKARINWKPTQDLRMPWQKGIVLWAFIIFACVAVFAFVRYPQTYARKPLSNPHSQKIDSKLIANRANENACTTCHSWDQPMENSCITCHQANEFHVSNTKAHEESGITCTVCHLEHQGENYQPRLASFQTCATCHSDNNPKLYNGKSVKTPHGGTFGYPFENGKWTWRGLSKETAETMLEKSTLVSAEDTEQERLSKQFHAIHIYQIGENETMKRDSAGTISCTSCHKSFNPIDRVTPKEMCASCHNGLIDKKSGGVVYQKNEANCVSCHSQHPFSQNRWNDFLSKDAANYREKKIGVQIERLNNNSK